jgi:heterodisulfide reductase subunit A-like polyferredoxin
VLEVKRRRKEIGSNLSHSLVRRSLVFSFKTDDQGQQLQQGSIMMNATTAAARILMATTIATTDVIVIGAGAAGLSAANDLIKAGWNVAVLEASNQIGGRLKKDETLANFPIDVGGEWISVRTFVLLSVLYEKCNASFSFAFATCSSITSHKAMVWSIYITCDYYRSTPMS